MAQAKRKRRTKHRGTQAGTVEVRGRTSRPASRAQARQQVMQRRQGQRLERAVQPPTWRGAVIRAAFAAVVFLVILIAVMGERPVTAIFVSALMFGVYIPMGYYMDGFFYARRRRREARQSEAASSANAAAKTKGGGE